MSARLVVLVPLLLGGVALGFQDSVIDIPEAAGPPAHPTCREALDLPPPEEHTPAVEPETPTVELQTPAEEPPTPPDVPAARPAELPLQPLEGPPEVLAAVVQVFDRGDAKERVRLSFYGASHTSADWWTGRIRRVLQDRWGDLGHGFVMPAALYSGYRGQDVNLCRTSGWRSDWAGKRRGRDDGLLGFAGMSVSSSDPEDFGWIQTTSENPHGRKVAWFDVYTLGQPSGGTLRVDVDGASTRAIPTEASSPSLQRTRIRVPDGGHRLTLSPAGDGEARVLGVSLERPGAGVLVDAMGVRGRRARDWLRWEPELASAGLQSLDPDLVVLAYGTNEAADPKYTMDEYRADLHGVLARLRESAPTVACVLVGPSDRTKRIRGVWTTWSRTEQVAAIQRELAPQYGCAFWDWQGASGGPGSMRVWQLIEPRLAAKDGIHFTRDGYEWSADRFVAAIDALRIDPESAVAGE